ncbi:TadE/TadG family type IV pilus assembly protein [Bremerella sp. P1]|uniref:TadE/TadG family type IV pilus assembly protein n=1 Tax=Bremerella sp. P1 TaxID=3026424 RepID=UPI002368F2C1|nr:TadE/TadG family type IV pilus assembly protein [Bremerella sp. P1]WDI42133.1 TadE/TadG family type IV pilus assembly protein [Bremerella sp. P1]
MTCKTRVARFGRSRRRSDRSGATLIEFAIVGPTLFLLLFGFLILTLGVYRYQQVAYLARHGARYASTHGAQYRADNRLPSGDTATWIEDIRTNGVLPRSSGLVPDLVTVDADWSSGDNTSNTDSGKTGDFNKVVQNTVTVTVTYTWLPEAYLAGPISLSSNATVAMSY